MEFILYPPKSAVAFYLFNIPIYYYGLIMTGAIFIGMLFCSWLILKKHSKKEGESFLDIIPLVIISSIFGARLFYVLGDIAFYLKHPMEILLINHGGLSFYGGLLFGILSFLMLCKKTNLEPLKTFDALAVTMPLCQAIGRWGNFFNQEAYGCAYNGFLKLFVDLKHRHEDYLNIQYYHPTFLYESVLNLILFSVLLTIYFKNKSIKSGVVFSLYLISYSLIRFFIERLRLDSILNIGTIPIAQLISVFVFIFALILLFKFQKEN